MRVNRLRKKCSKNAPIFFKGCAGAKQALGAKIHCVRRTKENGESVNERENLEEEFVQNWFTVC
jgi:hypothetical protein